MNVRVRHVLLTLGKELRETLRDRRTLAMMILVPLVVYPLLALVMGQLIFRKEKSKEERPSAVAVVGGGPAATELRTRIGTRPKLFTLQAAGTAADVEAGRVDAVLVTGAAAAEAKEAETKETARSGAPAPVQIIFDAARDESREAEERLSDLVAHAMPAECVRYDVGRKNLASGTKIGSYLLAKVLPLAMVLMVLLGAFYPAVDVTAGERERGTLETVLTAPIERFDLLLGKVLAVTIIAGLTGLLNLGSMAVTLIHTFHLADPTAALPVPWFRAAASTLVIAPAAFLFGALFVAIGSTARGFKEAQSYLMPVYFVGAAPAMIGGVGEYALSGRTALVPAMNVTLLARELLLGTAHLGGAVITLVSTVVYGCIALAFAARIYDSERFVDPAAARGRKKSPGGGEAGGADQASHDGDDRRLEDADSRAPSAGQALLVFTIAFLLLLFVFARWQQRNLVVGLLATQWLGMVGLVAIFARINGQSLAGLIALRAPSLRVVAGAVLVGSSAWAVVALLSEWLVPVPKEVLEQLRRALLPQDQNRGLFTNLLLVAATPAVCEEVLFRGVVLRGLATRLAPAAAVAITGILFGLFHLDVWRLLPSTVLGILLSWVALETGSLVPSIIIHFLNNAILVTLSSTGLEARLGSLDRKTGVVVLVVALLVASCGAYLLRRSRREGRG